MVFLLAFVYIGLFPLQAKGRELVHIQASVKDSIIDSHLENIRARDTIRSHRLPLLYESWKKASATKKWGKKIFNFLVREPAAIDTARTKKTVGQEVEPYAGKIIRKIEIVVLDPFGTYISNPDSINPKYDKGRYRSLNKSHMETRRYVIRTYLQFKVGDYLDPVAVAESEAFLRDMDYINDIDIQAYPVDFMPDFVDVKVIVKDRWSIAAEIRNLSKSRATIEVYDENILGSGNRLGVRYMYSHKYGKRSGGGGYFRINNFMKTYFDIEGDYFDRVRWRDMDFAVRRNLLTNINYFGEAKFRQSIMRSSFAPWDSISADFQRDVSFTIGRAFTLPDEKATKRIVAALAYKQKWPEYRRAEFKEHMQNRSIPPPYQFVRNKIFMGQLSLYRNSYSRDYMVTGFGVPEDMAQGYNFTLTGGYSIFDEKRILNSGYAALKASFGSHQLTKGSLYGETSLSSFFNKHETFQSVFKLKLRYYTRLLLVPHGRLRQFVTLNYVNQLSPDKYLGDRIDLDDFVYMRARDHTKTRGGQEMLGLKSQSNYFSKWSIAGCRMMYYNFIDVGWHAKDGNLFHKKNFFCGIGIGVRIRNEHLVFKTINIRVGYYPMMGPYDSGFMYWGRSSSPGISPRFIPDYPDVITLDRPD